LSAVDGLVQLSFLIQNALSTRAEESGLSLSQTRLLGVLRDRTPSVNELAGLLELDKSSVSGLLSRAENRGLIERVASAADRRVVVIRLTRKGRSFVSKAAEAFEGDVSRLLALLPPKEATTLAKITSRLVIAHADNHGVDLFSGATPLAVSSR
jgi:DNA-binding MarR family transcriptional regulator